MGFCTVDFRIPASRFRLLPDGFFRHGLVGTALLLSPLAPSCLFSAESAVSSAPSFSVRLSVQHEKPLVAALEFFQEPGAALPESQSGLRDSLEITAFPEDMKSVAAVMLRYAEAGPYAGARPRVSLEEKGVCVRVRPARSAEGSRPEGPHPITTLILQWDGPRENGAESADAGIPLGDSVTVRLPGGIPMTLPVQKAEGATAEGAGASPAVIPAATSPVRAGTASGRAGLSRRASFQAGGKGEEAMVRIRSFSSSGSFESSTARKAARWGLDGRRSF